MNKELKIKNFSCYNISNDARIGILFSACNSISCTFQRGLNILYGSIDDGGWALCSALINKKTVISSMESSEFMLNNFETTIEHLNQSTHNLGIHYKYKNVFTILHSTVEQAIYKALKNSNNPYTVKDILDLFCLQNSIRSQKMSTTRNSLFRCNAAVGFAAKKLIFCFPWLSRRESEFYISEIISLGKLLNDFEKIVLLPTENVDQYVKNQFPIVDFTLDSSHYHY